VIDNGASFYFHHDWKTWENHLTRTFPLIKDHVLLQKAKRLEDASKEIQNRFDKDLINEIITNIPEEWLVSESDSINSEEVRAAYIEFLKSRLSKIDVLIKEIADAR